MNVSIRLFFTLIILLVLLLPAYAQRGDFWETDFHKADSIAEAYENRSVQKPELLAELLTKDLTTEVEKFRAIFRWITNNIKYDFRLLHEMERKEAKLRRKKKSLMIWRETFSKKVWSSAIKKKSTICGGYSQLLDVMANSVGIHSISLRGYVRDDRDKIGVDKVDHAWNAVSLNNKWYLCDPTWASGERYPWVDKFHTNFNKVYFLTEPDLFIANHYPEDPSWILTYNKPSLEEFLKGPIKEIGFLTYKVNNYSPTLGKVKIGRDSTLTIRFTSNYPQEICTATVEFFEKTRVSTKHNLYKDTEGYYYLNHIFKTRGQRKIYIYLEGSLAFIYDVVIK